jgi:hypothetical protein
MRPCGRKWRTRSLQLADLVWNEHAACWKSLLRCHFQIIGSERVLFEMLSGTLYTDDPFLRRRLPNLLSLRSHIGIGDVRNPGREPYQL